MGTGGPSGGKHAEPAGGRRRTAERGAGSGESPIAPRARSTGPPATGRPLRRHECRCEPGKTLARPSTSDQMPVAGERERIPVVVVVDPHGESVDPRLVGPPLGCFRIIGREVTPLITCRCCEWALEETGLQVVDAHGWRASPARLRCWLSSRRAPACTPRPSPRPQTSARAACGPARQGAEHTGRTGSPGPHRATR